MRRLKVVSGQTRSGQNAAVELNLFVLSDCDPFVEIALFFILGAAPRPSVRPFTLVFSIIHG